MTFFAITVTMLAGKNSAAPVREGSVRPRAHRAWASLFQATSESFVGTGTDVEVTTVVTAADGSWATSKSKRRAGSVATSGASTLSRAFGFQETCLQLYWFGYHDADVCRDSSTPELSLSNCRCVRRGTAWPAKFCTTQKFGRSASPLVSEDISSAHNNTHEQAVGGMPTSLLMRREIGYGNNGTNTSLDSYESASRRTDEEKEEQEREAHRVKRLDDEVYGICDQCCVKTSIYMWKLLSIVMFPVLCCLGCCGYFTKLSFDRKKLIKQLEVLAETQHQLEEHLADVTARLPEVPRVGDVTARLPERPRVGDVTARLPQVPRVGLPRP